MSRFSGVRFNSLIVCVAAAALIAAIGSAQNTVPRATGQTAPGGSAGSPSADLEAITKSADAFTVGYNAGDAKALAALFTPEAEFVDGLGNVHHGRAAIEATFVAGFEANPKSRIVIDMDTVRLVSAGVLAEEGTSTILSADDAPVTASAYIVIHAKQPDGKWLMASVRCTRDEPANAHEHLKPLSWLVGSWVDESDDSTVETAWRWSEDGNYLLGDFDVKIGNLAVMKGTQRLGWDPSKGCVRNWVFDSEGGFIEGYWTETEDGWLVKSTGFTPTGDTASATNVYQRTSQDSFMWTSQDRVVGAGVMPDLQVKIVRSPPKPQAKK